ncbi:phosphate/phosphite/phosphonate ABC transporter substrate-binding protein [Ilumatobacter nonamiensis]|uniref:phosphate/phosphite/phosphonate ABC transporter substrate-binding protein n=1 Tax=Ilumatobacter nonamiensis TaxID=467093 RepID=UPI000685571A|nr:phosphate/phosphite/phosphonate ABC transporter substrate-binding protein [Ilumatobacter nonamiensis]
MNRRNLVALGAAGALVLAACGSDDDSSSETDTTEASSDTEAAEEEAATTEAMEEESETTEAMEEESDTTEAMEEETESTEAAGEESAAETPEDWPDDIVFTLTPSQETGGLIETAQPLADMLADELGIGVEALVPTDYAGVIVALESGQAQVAGGLGPRQMVQSEEQAGAELILQSERFGSLLYVTQWFTNDPDTYCEDEPVADEESGYLFCNGVLDADGDASLGPIGQDQLTNVEGQTVAFVDQGSTSGYAIPALQLSEAGVDPIDGIDALFAGGHDTAVQAVYDGDAAVGVSFNDARDELVEQVPDVGEQVVVFGWSGPIPNDGFAVAGDLPDSLVTAISDAFVAIAGTEEGAAVLSELYSIDDLVPVNSADYDVIRDLETELGDVLE